jgi:iron complex outermembrane recepter protein
LLDFRFGITNIGRKPIDFNLFMKNANNITYVAGGTAQENTLGIVSALFGEPRTYGAQLRIRFGGNVR